MMEIVLYDRSAWRKHLLPFAFTRSVGNLRVGILTLQEKWERLFQVPVRYCTEPYLQTKFLPPSGGASSYLVIRANVCPNDELVAALKDLSLSTVLKKDGEWLAFKVEQWQEDVEIGSLQVATYTGTCDQIRHLEDIFLKNRTQILFDFALLTQNRPSVALSSSNTVLGEKEALFVGQGVRAEACIFNTACGPIYIDDDVLLEEGSYLKGPVAVCRGARVKMGSRIYPNVTVGPYSTIAGEVNNAVLLADSTKGHDGYLGCAVLGEGCNLGAGTSNSNLLNTWKEVKLFDYKERDFRSTGQRKVGTFVGDFAMCGINSSITTGNIIGVGAQIAISNIIPKFVVDFCWWTAGGKTAYAWEKFAEMMRQRALVKKQALDEVTFEILKEVYHQTTEMREEFIKQTN